MLCITCQCNPRCSNHLPLTQGVIVLYHGHCGTSLKQAPEGKEVRSIPPPPNMVAKPLFMN